MADNGSVINNAKSALSNNPIKKANSELDKLIADNKNIARVWPPPAVERRRNSFL